MTWQPVIDQRHAHQRLAQEMGGTERVAKHLAFSYMEIVADTRQTICRVHRVSR